MDTRETVTNVGVLDKAVRLLSILTSGASDLAALTRSTGYSRATTHRLLQSLEAHGLVRRDDAGDYALGLRLCVLGERAADGYPLAEAAMPALEKLQKETGEGAQLFIASGRQRLCVAAVESRHNLREIVPVGALFPIDAGSAGRVLRAELSASGIAATTEERAVGVASVSAPVYSRDGHVIAAVSASGPISRMTRRPGSKFGEAVLRTASRIERALRKY